MNNNKELVGASTALIVLGVLARKASWGYEIVRQVNEEADGVFTWREGTVYPVLHRLEKDGLVRSQWEETDAGRRRKYYTVTARGRECLAEGAREWKWFHGLVLRLAEAPNG